MKGSAWFENCETEFRYSKCIRQGGVEAPVLWGRWPSTCFGKLKKDGKPEDGDCHLGGGGGGGGESDNEYVLRSMMWADNNWLFCHSREILVHMVNGFVEELLNLDRNPKPESLWWTSSYEEEDKLTLQVGGGGKDWELPFREVFEGWVVSVFSVMEKAHKGSKRHCAKGWAAGGATLKFIVRKAFL